jgi:hypothetical protein
MPATPAASSAIEAALVAVVGMTRNPFTGAQWTQDWQAGWKELSLPLRPMTAAEAAPWLAFLAALNGPGNVFTFGSAFCAAYPGLLTDGALPTPNPLYWRLKSGLNKVTVGEDRYYRIPLDVIQAF